MNEGKVVSWSDFVREEMPKTKAQFKAFFDNCLKEVKDLVGNPTVITHPNDDPVVVAGERANLVDLSSTMVGIKSPFDVIGSDCVRETTVALIRRFTRNPEPLVEAASNAFQTFRLAAIGYNARSADPARVDVAPETEKGAYREIDRLVRFRSGCFVGTTSEGEIGLMLSAAEKVADHTDRQSLDHIGEAGGVLGKIERNQWPLLEKLCQRGEQLVVKTYEARGVRHIDLIQRIDTGKGIADTAVQGTRQIADLHKAMMSRNQPIIGIPPEGIAQSDKEEIKLRSRLYGLPWNPNV